MTKRGTSLLLDAVMFVGFGALLSWRLTGVAAHEWIGISLIGLIVVHLIVHWGWVESHATAVRRGRRRLVPLLLNAALYVAMGTTLVSGVVVSKVVIPNQLSPERYLLWHSLHESATTFTVIILGLHVALNWDHIRGWIRRGFNASRRVMPTVQQWWRVPPRLVLRRLAWIVAVSTVFVACVWEIARFLPAPTEVTMVFPDGHREQRPPPPEISRLLPQSNRPSPVGAVRVLMNLVLLSIVAAAGRRALRRPRASVASRATRAPPVAAP